MLKPRDGYRVAYSYGLYTKVFFIIIYHFMFSSFNRHYAHGHQHGDIYFYHIMSKQISPPRVTRYTPEDLLKAGPASTSLRSHSTHESPLPPKKWQQHVEHFFCKQGPGHVQGDEFIR